MKFKSIYDISKNKQTGEMNIKLNVPMSFLNNATYPAPQPATHNFSFIWDCAHLLRPFN